MVFHWSLSDSKSPQVSRTLLSILAVLNNAVIWMVSTRPLTSKSSSPFSNPLVTVPNTPITIGIIITCMFHNFFKSQARLRYLSFLLSLFIYLSIYYLLKRALSTLCTGSLFFLFFLFCCCCCCWLSLCLGVWTNLASFSHQLILVVFHWSLINSSYPQSLGLFRS